MKTVVFTLLGALAAASLLAAGLAGCARLLARPLPAKPPHDIVIEYDFSAGMTQEWAYIVITPDALDYRLSTREATEYAGFALEPGQFEMLYQALRALHPETIHSERRPDLAYDRSSTEVRVHAASIGYSSRATEGGLLTIPMEHAQRFAKIVDGIRNTAREVVDAARRPVGVCVDAGEETTVTYLRIGSHVVDDLRDNPVCATVALLDNQRYTVAVVFRERNSVYDDSRAAVHSFALERMTRQLTFVRRQGELHRVVPDGGTPGAPR